MTFILFSRPGAVWMEVEACDKTKFTAKTRLIRASLADLLARPTCASAAGEHCQSSLVDQKGRQVQQRITEYLRGWHCTLLHTLENSFSIFLYLQDFLLWCV